MSFHKTIGFPQITERIHKVSQSYLALSYQIHLLIERVRCFLCTGDKRTTTFHHQMFPNSSGIWEAERDQERGNGFLKSHDMIELEPFLS